MGYCHFNSLGLSFLVCKRSACFPGLKEENNAGTSAIRSTEVQCLSRSLYVCLPSLSLCFPFSLCFASERVSDQRNHNAEKPGKQTPRFNRVKQKDLSALPSSFVILSRSLALRVESLPCEGGGKRTAVTIESLT